MFGRSVLKKFGSQISEAMKNQPASSQPAPAKGPMGKIASTVANAVKNAQAQPAPAPSGGLRSIRQRVMEQMKNQPTSKQDMGAAAKNIGSKFRGVAGRMFQEGGEVDEMEMMGREGRNMAKAGMQKKMKSGGIASSLKAHAAAPASKAHAKKMMGGGMAKYAKGGKVDGCARKGKTKGRMV